MNNVEERACNNLGNGFIILSKNSINNSALEYFNSNKIIFLWTLPQHPCPSCWLLNTEYSSPKIVSSFF